MPRIRSVKPDYWKDEKLNTVCSREARRMFIGLWNLADDEGYTRGSSRYIKAELYAYDDDITAQHVEQMLRELEAGGFIVRYERDQQTWLWVRTFTEHQSINKPRKSTAPKPTAEERERRGPPPQRENPTHSGSPPGALRESSGSATGGNGMEWNGREGRTDMSSSASPEPDLDAEEPEPDRQPELTLTVVDGEGHPRMRVWRHWQTVMGSQRSQLDEKRRAAIDKGLRLGTLQECLDAIDGCKLSAWHMGDNDRGRKFNSLELIFRDREHIEKFCETKRAPPRRADIRRGSVRAEDIDPSAFDKVGNVDDF